MILLVVDTSGKNGIVALARGEQAGAELIEGVPLAGGMFSAQLVPQIAALLAKHGLTKKDLDAFVVVSGPGSFTGLRVGLAAVKALAEILHKPIAPVSLLEVVAVDGGRKGKVFAVLDAGRGEVYAGEYEVAGGSAELQREALLSKAEFLSAARTMKVVTPDASVVKMAESAGLSIPLVHSAAIDKIARLGWQKLQSGTLVSAEQLEANYMRRSDAEVAKPSC